MSAYYNELDPYAAEWLRNLQRAGLIATGDIDDRSISDVHPIDLIGYDQCHFFAGIGVWSHALRLAGWPDDRPVWTGSCPCQPFSAAGKQGGTSDERHLWPAWFSLIQKCRPPQLLGEQVEAAIRHGWLDLVQADLEGIGYAVAAAGIPAAGFGAPHIRQRLWFVADAELSERRPSDIGGAVDDRQARGRVEGADRLGECRDPSGLDHHHHHPRLEGLRSGHQAEVGQREGTVRPVASSSESGGMADADHQRYARQHTLLQRQDFGRAKQDLLEIARDGEISGRSGPVNGFWCDADWLPCRDNKWRPVEPGTFPLAHGATNRVGRVRADQERLTALLPRRDQGSRVGRLRAYGNAIVPQVAAEVIAAFMECRP